MARFRWHIKQVDSVKVEALSQDLKLGRLVAQILVARGYEDPETAYKFLNPSLSDLADPKRLPDASQAVRRLAQAIQKRERVLIYGDYDVDGVSATALWKTTLERLGASVIVKIPHRTREGYDLHPVAVELACEHKASLVLSCDCGTRAHSVVDALNQHNIEVIITDHHEPDTHLPNAVAVVNPKRADSNYPYPYLSGVGVSFRLAEALLSELKYPLNGFRQRMLDLVALGTVADVVPLTGENRVLVSKGLDILHATQRVGLKKLKEVAGIPHRPPTATDIGFRLAPRLNAAGRLDDAIYALELLITENETDAERLAEQLSKWNSERQSKEGEALKEAIQMVEAEAQLEHKAIIVGSSNWHHGIVGLVAGKLRERYARPAFAMSFEGESARGSIRSIPALNLIPLLKKMKSLCTKCGGHAIAGGFAIPIHKLDDLRTLIWDYTDSLLTDEDLIPTLEADAEASPQEINTQLYHYLKQLEPFGQENEMPLFICRDLRVIARRACSQNRHLFLELAHPRLRGSVPAVMWNGADYALEPETRIEIAFTVEWDDYFGGLRWNIKDFEERL